MKRVIKSILWGTAVVVIGLAGVILFPFVTPSLAWKTGVCDWQEMALPQLTKRVRPGMSNEEVGRLFGVRCTVKDGMWSFNVNSWYYTGLDVTFTNGCVASCFQYN